MTDTPQHIETPGAAATVFRDAPRWDDLKTAAIGALDCADPKAGAALISTLSLTLKDEGFDAVIAPMDGDTWHPYRVVTESDGSPPFLLEPVSGPHDLEILSGAGFQPVSQYVSSRADLEATLGAHPAAMDGVTVSAWDGGNPSGFIEQLFDMSSAAFEGNRFFKPIGKDRFLELYQPILPLVDPAHVLFAHADDGRLVGFLFGMPDRLQGDRPDSVILKTYASAVRGVGHLLADTYHRRALDLGFARVIHALMHVDNASHARSDQHSAVIFRRYALMGKRL